MQIEDIILTYEKDLKLVEEFLDKEQNSYVKLIPQISSHIIASGGKRLRPLLLLISSDLFKYCEERRHVLAAVIEFIHTASLLHDDVIDHANIRRGRAAANKLWGNTASILVGDYLYATAFRLLTEDGDPVVQRIISSATTTMVEGETIQFIKSGDAEITEQEYLSIIEKKTAILMSASCALGAALAGQPQESIRTLSSIGLKIGVSFQVTDDTLDYVGVKEEFGKNIGMDLREGKMTLPLIWALKKGSLAEKEAVIKIIKHKSAEDEDILTIIDFIKNYGGIEYALGKAAQYIGEAKALIKSFPDSSARKYLLSIADYVLNRNN
ncbi:MAG: polyprenyl synthetase family protein [Syntrophales bacterium]|jgi:octaprenyl-diphosphate synthase|nr:polyprenyl synthetase family protein [Syntrophales bacterium]MDY0043417.1 polyprenyl synthetase family protein [Syntrophales bacterium]